MSLTVTLTTKPSEILPPASWASYHPRRVTRRRWWPAVLTPPIVIIVGFFFVIGAAASASAQAPGSLGDDDAPCFFLCAPDVKIEPTVTFEPVFRRPTIEELADGVVVSSSQPDTEAVFELILAVGIPTEIPRVGFTVETIFIPSGDVDANPFTGATADDLGRPALRGNEVEVELELNLGLIEPEQTGGWLESHFDIVDKISAAERPTDTSAYTHKLNFEWDTAFLAFKWLPESNYLHHVEIEGSLDYVATGLPARGDVLSGTERFVDDDSPWSFSLVFVFPLAPLP